MGRLLLAMSAVLGLASTAPAAVVVVANFTPADLTIAVTEPERKPQTIKLSPAQIAPVRVTGPADITYPARPAKATFRLDPYNAYVLLPDEKAGCRLEGLELPGHPPERDARPELNPPPPEPVKVPVTLLVDDADPRADKLWQETLRKRFDAAAAVVEAHSGVRLEFAGFATWPSDPLVTDVPGLLTDFETKVKVKPGQLAIGYTSRKVEEKEKEPAPYGATKLFPTTHVLMREWVPRAETERVEVLIHHLGLALGATLTPDPGSVMRPKPADGLALVPQYRFRFDPFNTLAMSIWADELRRGPLASVGDASAANKIRLARIYKALLKARPGDSLALTYLNEFDRDIARAPAPKAEPKGMNPEPVAKKDPPKEKSLRDEVARKVVKAVTERVRMNVGPDAISGDDLTSSCIQVAADAALKAEGLPGDSPDRVAGFILGLGVALDDTDALLQDPLTDAFAKAIETADDREERIALLGNPTIRGRRDFCRRFAVGCVKGELLLPHRAEEDAINRSLTRDAVQRPVGISCSALAAEFAGIEFARSLRDDTELLRRLGRRFSASDVFPSTAGLRDGLSWERFQEDYGDASDSRFRAVVADIRGRVKKAAAMR